MSIERILVIDDEEIMRDFIAETLRRDNFDVSIAESGKEGILTLHTMDVYAQ